MTPEIQALLPLETADPDPLEPARVPAPAKPPLARDTPPVEADRAGEVILASATHFTAQCPRNRLHEPPIFGTFVKIEPAGVRRSGNPANAAPAAEEDPFADPVPAANSLPDNSAEGTIYALVYAASTGSAEPGRRPTAYGLEEDDLREQQPQIFDLLATEFSALHTGVLEDGRLRSRLPPRPPRLHAPVRECTDAETRALSDSPDLLRSLLQAPQDVPVDELIAACLRCGYRCRGEDFAYLVRMARGLALLLREDPDRLTALLRKIEP